MTSRKWEIPSGIVRGEGGVIGEGRLVGEQNYSLLYMHSDWMSIASAG